MTIKNINDYTEYSEKLDNGQSVVLRVNYWRRFNVYRCYIALYINKRKYGYVDDVQTGKSGIEGLLWAKEMLKDIIEKDIANNNNYLFEYIIFPTDKHRMNVYLRGLNELGFKKCRIDGEMGLMLKVHSLNNVNE